MPLALVERSKIITVLDGVDALAADVAAAGEAHRRFPVLCVERVLKRSLTLDCVMWDMKP